MFLQMVKKTQNGGKCTREWALLKAGTVANHLCTGFSEYLEYSEYIRSVFTIYSVYGGISEVWSPLPSLLVMSSLVQKGSTYWVRKTITAKIGRKIYIRTYCDRL